MSVINPAVVFAALLLLQACSVVPDLPGPIGIPGL